MSCGWHGYANKNRVWRALVWAIDQKVILCQHPRCWWQALPRGLHRNYPERVPCCCRLGCTNFLVWWLGNVSVNCNNVCASVCVTAGFSCPRLYYCWSSSRIELSSVTRSGVSFPSLIQHGKIIQNEVSYWVPVSSVPNFITFSKCNCNLYVFGK